MERVKQLLPTIRNYTQPSMGFRKVEENHELVDYPPNSTFRIWHSDSVTDYSLHWHSAVEIIYVSMGYCDASFDQAQYELHTGDILIIPADEMHAMSSRERSEHFVLMFEPEELFDLKGFTTLLPLMRKPILIRENSPIHEQAMSLLTHAINAYFSDEDYAELSNYARVLSLYALIGRQQLSDVKQNANTTESRRQTHMSIIHSIMDYIDQHYMEDLDLERISAEAGFSKFHFSRLFKQYTNTTFHQFLTLKRIEMAERLLSGSEGSIAKIAMQVGFTSLPTFNRAYKYTRGYPPTVYRSIARREGTAKAFTRSTTGSRIEE